MAVKSSSGYKLPPPCDGVNVNFCKNPKCANFGVPEIPNRGRRRNNTAPLPGFYIRITKGKSGESEPLLQCSICKERQPLRNNASIVEEIDRISAYLKLNTEPTCPNPTCGMHTIPLSKGGDNYASFGSSAAGTPRWRCNICRKTFTAGGNPTRKQKITHKNRDVLMMFMNKMGINRLSEVTGLSNDSLYRKVDFIHRQCMMFIQSREKVLLEDFPLPKMYVAVDRQSHIVNWNNRKDRRNIVLHAIGTADLNSGYVLGMHLNFDTSMTQEELDSLAQQAGDYETPKPYRKYARFWLKPDYDEAIKRSSSKAKGDVASAMRIARGEDKLTSTIEGNYLTSKSREDIEDVEEMNENLMLPINGVLIKQQYAIVAHFIQMAKLLRNAPKVRFYLDQDSGFRAAFMAAFHDRVKARTADAWYVTVLKGLNIDKKDAIIKESKRKFEEVQAANPSLTEYEVKLLMVKDELHRAQALGFPDDFWLAHPIPNKSETAKKICWLTNPGTCSEDHMARMYLRASLHPIDRFFMVIRRRISYAERAYASSNQTGRKWYGYNAYRPDNLAKILDIFRVFYNYCLVGPKDKKTPAMRLGLARGPVAPEDVLYFEPNLTDRVPNPNRTKAKAQPAKKKETSGESVFRSLNENKPWEHF